MCVCVLASVCVHAGMGVYLCVLSERGWYVSTLHNSHPTPATSLEWALHTRVKHTFTLTTLLLLESGSCEFGNMGFRVFLCHCERKRCVCARTRECVDVRMVCELAVA